MRGGPAVFSALHSAAVANTPVPRIQESPENDVNFPNVALPCASFIHDFMNTCGIGVWRGSGRRTKWKRMITFAAFTPVTYSPIMLDFRLLQWCK
jgi:hypothetical protein